MATLHFQKRTGQVNTGGKASSSAEAVSLATLTEVLCLPLSHVANEVENARTSPRKTSLRDTCEQRERTWVSTRRQAAVFYTV